MLHVHVSCGEFERSGAFYEMLEFQVYWPIPKTNTHEVANALGMPNYEVRSALLALQNAERSMVIDPWSGVRLGMTPCPIRIFIGLGSHVSHWQAQTLIKTMTFFSQRVWTCWPHPLMCAHRTLATVGSSAL